MFWALQARTAKHTSTLVDNKNGDRTWNVASHAILRVAEYHNLRRALPSWHLIMPPEEMVDHILHLLGDESGDAVWAHRLWRGGGRYCDKWDLDFVLSDWNRWLHHVLFFLRSLFIPVAVFWPWVGSTSVMSGLWIFRWWIYHPCPRLLQKVWLTRYDFI